MKTSPDRPRTIRPWIRRGVFGFFVLYLLAVTWPVAIPFSSAEPFIVGFPLSLAWPIAWIVMGGLALWLLDATEEAGE